MPWPRRRVSGKVRGATPLDRARPRTRACRADGSRPLRVAPVRRVPRLPRRHGRDVRGDAGAERRPGLAGLRPDARPALARPGRPRRGAPLPRPHAGGGLGGRSGRPPGALARGPRRRRRERGGAPPAQPRVTALGGALLPRAGARRRRPRLLPPRLERARYGAGGPGALPQRRDLALLGAPDGDGGGAGGGRRPHRAGRAAPRLRRGASRPSRRSRPARGARLRPAASSRSSRTGCTSSSRSRSSSAR